MKIGVGLYVKNSVEAVALYEKAFGLELGYHVKNPDGSFFHSELYQNGQEILSVVEATHPSGTERKVQLGVEFSDAAGVHAAFALLAEGGSVDMPIGPLPWSPCAASVIDRFGVWWYLSTCSHHPPEDYDATKPWEPDMYKKP